MRTAEAFRVAVDALRANRLRSLLTMLGVIIGVAAVIVVVSIGAGARSEIQSQVQGLGSNLVLVVPGRFDGAAGGAPTVSRLQLDDVALLGEVVGDERAVTTRVTSGESVRAGSNEVFVTVQGSDQNLPFVFDRPVSRGEYLTSTDVATRRRVAVLGPDSARSLFADVDPIGQQVTIGGVRFRVIGVLESRGATFGVTQDTEVHVPVTAAQRLLGVNRVDAIAVKAPSTEGIEELQERLVAALEDKYPGDAFSAVTQTQILGVIGEILGLLTLVLASIAGISLLVGGVGVSNIMLVSVRERTREIGLRKALGARQRDIGVQFLVEAVLLTCAGGVIGIGIGVAVSVALGSLSPLPTQIEWWSPAVAFGVSAAVGVFFGVAPARRAGRLDPVVALRTD